VEVVEKEEVVDPIVEEEDPQVEAVPVEGGKSFKFYFDK
jgi:hypothetical protein